MARELLGRVSPATQELLGHGIDLRRALRRMKLKIEELLGPRALRAFGIRADELKNIHLDKKIIRRPPI